MILLSSENQKLFKSLTSPPSPPTSFQPAPPWKLHHLWCHNLYHSLVSSLPCCLSSSRWWTRLETWPSTETWSTRNSFILRWFLSSQSSKRIWHSFIWEMTRKWTDSSTLKSSEWSPRKSDKLPTCKKPDGAYFAVGTWQCMLSPIWNFIRFVLTLSAPKRAKRKKREKHNDSNWKIIVDINSDKW